MRYRIKETYTEDLNMFDEKYKFYLCAALVVSLFFLPLFLDSYVIYIFNLLFIYIIISIGLNLLTGNTGLVSLGHAAFVAVGAYSSAILTTKASLPFWIAFPLSGLITAAVGIVVAVPALRTKGFYLAIITLGFSFIIEEFIIRWESLTNGALGMKVPSASIGNIVFDTENKFYYLIFPITVICIIAVKNLLRTGFGKALGAIRDNDIAAESIGINLIKYKFMVFGVSAFLAGIAGSFMAHLTKMIGPSSFTLLDSITYLVIIVIGGLGSLMGSILGAIFITFLPEVIRFLKDFIPGVEGIIQIYQSIFYGLIMMLFLLFEPNGFFGRWVKIKYYFETFPVGRKVKKKKVIVTSMKKM